MCDESGSWVQGLIRDVIATRRAAFLLEHEGSEAAGAGAGTGWEGGRPLVEVVVEEGTGGRAKVGRGRPDAGSALPESSFIGGGVGENVAPVV